ncbi:S8 family peptidase [Leptospira sp. 'Mane']
MFRLLVTFCLVACFQCQIKSQKSDKNSILWLNQILLPNGSKIPYSPESCNPITSPNDSLFPYQWHLKNTGQAMYSPIHPAGVAGNDINVVPTWSMGLSGKGTLVSIVDDGVVLEHEDLQPNATAASINFLYGTNGLASNDPGGSLANHGTSVAGVISARGGNNLGITGVAPCSEFLVYNYLSKSTDSNMTQSLTENKSVFVSNNSWGSEDGSGNYQRAPNSFYTAIESGIANNREGKGTVYVWAAGNGAGTFGEPAGTEVDNSNYDGYTSHYGIITVAGALNTGVRAAFSEKGSNLWLTGYTGRDGNVNTGITTTDNIGANLEWGYNPGGGDTAYPDTSGFNYPDRKYTSSFNGTSAAAPMITGVVSLLLEKYPTFTWRDVKKILAKSAKKIDPSNTSWVTTTPGIDFSTIYGFGAVDAEKTLQTAASWTSLGGSANLKTWSTEGTVNLAIDQSGSFSTQSIAVSGSQITKIESIKLILTSNHPSPGEIRIQVQSPTSPVTRTIEIHEPHLCYSGEKKTLPTKDCSAMTNQFFEISGYLDFPVDGTWKILIKDENNGTPTGNLTYYKIIFYGS